MEDHLFFPLFFDLSGKTALVVGGGAVAARRIKTLLPFVGRVSVVAPECTPEVRALAEAGELTLWARPFEDTDPEGAFLVLCATGDAALDGHVQRLCREKGILVNIASDKDKCDFYFPGVARDGSVVVGVTACGTDHKKARETTEKIRRLLEKE